MRVFWCFVLMVFAVPCFAQKEAYNWYFGDSAAITFKNGVPETLSGSAMYAHEGCASISDKTGKLLFYTNSDKVWNANHQIMSNGNNMMGGDTLGGNGTNSTSGDPPYSGSSAAQAALIVPHPGNPKQFFIFIAPGAELPAIPYLYYSMVDMDKDGGLGDVILKNGVLPKVSACEKLTATVDCSGQGFWVISHHELKNEFYTFHIGKKGIENKVIISQVGEPVTAGADGSRATYGYANCMKTSPNGKMIASPGGYNNPIVEVFNFDNETGKVSNPRVIPNAGGYGITFSPDNTKLYTSGIVQYTVSETATSEEIIASQKIIFSKPGARFATFQIGPDKKIYIAETNASKILSINNPNKDNATVTEDVVDVRPGRVIFGLPNYIDNIFNEGESPISCKSYFLSDTICEGRFASFRDTMSSSLVTGWQWEFPGGVPMISTEQNPKNIFYPKSGEYPVKLIRFSSYFGSDTVFSTVLVHPRPLADAGSDITLCPGSSAQIGNPAIAGNTYLWTPTDGLDNPNIAQPTVTSVSDGKKYFVKVTNEYGCEAIDSVIVSIGPIKAIVVDTTVCRGSAVVLKASGGSEYEWSPSDGLSATTGASVTASPLQDITYQVIAQSGDCRDTAFLKVTVLDAPVADAGSDKEICAGESVELGGAAEAGLSYAWSPTDGLLKSNVSNPIATVLKTTEYVLTVTNEAGCVAHDTVVITVGDILKVIASNDTAVCEGESVQLSAVSDDGVVFTWSPQTGLDNPNIANPFAKPEETTTYIVTAFKNGGLCSGVDSVRIEVLKTPVIETKDISLCEGESAELEVSSDEEIVSWSWTPATGLSDPNIQNPIATAFKNETYLVTARNVLGCETTKALRLEIMPKENFTAVLKSDKGELEPGESTILKMFLKAENALGITSFKATISFDKNVFQFTPNSGKFLNGADNTWFLKADMITPGELHIEANGQTPIVSSEIAFGLTAYLAKQVSENILLKITEINGEAVFKNEACRTIAEESTNMVLKEVCAGDMRLVKIGEFETFLKAVTPNPATGETIEIEYSIGIEGNIALEIYNSHGELLKTIFKGNQKAGVFKEMFSTDELPAGVFLVKLSTLQATETQMLTIVK